MWSKRIQLYFSTATQPLATFGITSSHTRPNLAVAWRRIWWAVALTGHIQMFNHESITGPLMFLRKNGLVAFARTIAVFFPPDRLVRAGRSTRLASVETSTAAMSLASVAALSSGPSTVSSTSIAFRPALVICNEYGLLSSSRRQTGRSAVARSS
jgi:hypothetical protein